MREDMCSYICGTGSAHARSDRVDALPEVGTLVHHRRELVAHD